MTGLVAKKIGIKEGSRAILINAPEEAVAAISLPHLDISKNLAGDFDYILFFTKTQAEFDDIFPKLKAHLKLSGALWVSWPKSGQLGTDLSLTKVINLGYNHGLVESKCLSVNPIWPGLKFTHPKKGKVYNNRYGKLKQ